MDFRERKHQVRIPTYIQNEQIPPMSNITTSTMGDPLSLSCNEYTAIEYGMIVADDNWQVAADKTSFPSTVLKSAKSEKYFTLPFA